MKQEQLKEGMICICKGGTWYKSINKIKEGNYNYMGWFGLITKLITMSRYTHTFTIVKYKRAWKIVEAGPKGVVMRALNIQWLLKEIEENRIDIYEESIFDREYFFEKYNEFKGRKYWYLGLVNIGLYNLFGKSLVNKTYTKKLFCSHLTTLLHNLSEHEFSHMNSPGTLGHMNILKRTK